VFILRGIYTVLFGVVGGGREVERAVSKYRARHRTLQSGARDPRAGR
jgi:hypothetical protein